MLAALSNKHNHSKLISAGVIFLLLCVYNYLLYPSYNQFNLGGYRDLFYVFSYSTEFMKRGLIGTVLELLHLPPSFGVIRVLFMLSANIFFFLLLRFLQSYLLPLQKEFFWCLFIFFIIAPFTADDWGYDFARSDIYLLVIELAIILLSTSKQGYLQYAIPFLLSAGLLIHEAFLFLNAPLVLLLLLHRYTKGNVSRPVIILSFTTVAVTFACLFFYGNVSAANLQKIYYTAYHEQMPAVLPPDHPTMVISSSLKTNVLFTFNTYASPKIWKGFFLIVPFLFAYVYLYKKFFFRQGETMLEKAILLAPFFCLPMFFLGIDTYRWLSLAFINMIFAAVIISKDRLPAFSRFSGPEKLAVCILFFYCLLGPIGADVAFPKFAYSYVLKN